MLRFFFKLLIITSFMLTYTNASTSTKNKTIQDELTNIKIELSKIKLTQKYENRDNKIKEIEQNIKDLEVKVNKTVAKDIEKQDKRISDIGFYLTVSAIIVTFFGILITGIILFFTLKHSVIAKSQAREEVEKWVKEKADAEFKEKVDEYLEQLENKANRLLEKLENKANEQYKNHDKRFEDKIAEFDLMKNASPEDKEKINNDVKALEKTHKAKSEYSFSDWYSKFLQKYFEPDFKKALEYINNALKIVTNDVEEAKAIYAKALTLGKLGKSEEAIAEYDKVIDRFSKSENESLLEIVANALYNKGVRLGELGKSEEAIAEYDKVIDRFSKSENESLLETVAKALYNKGVTLGELGKSEEEIAEYEKVIDRFSKSENESLLEQVAKALYNKGVGLGQLGKSEEEIAEYEKVIDKFSKSENERILEQVASALVNKIELMIISNKDISDDIKFYKKLFSKDKNKMMQISMLEILNNAKKSDQDRELQEWKEIYKEQSLGNWGFTELDEWNESMTDETVKQRVKKYIDEFKSFKE